MIEMRIGNKIALIKNCDLISLFFFYHKLDSKSLSHFVTQVSGSIQFYISPKEFLTPMLENSSDGHIDIKTSVVNMIIQRNHVTTSLHTNTPSQV
jgi:hypothetical protein